jgi:hypothetical protein
LEYTKKSQDTPVYDASGTWDANQTNFWNTCGDDNPDVASSTLDINQNGNIISADNGEGNILRGFANGNVYTMAYSYPELGGITTQVCDVTLSSATQGGGNCWWIRDQDNDSSLACNGGSMMTIDKQVVKQKVLPGIPMLLLNE